MKKVILLCTLFLIICSCQKDTSDVENLPASDQITTRAKNPPILVCHYDPVNDTYKTLSLKNFNAVNAHLKHGDKLGECGVTPDCDPACIFCDYITLFDFDEPCPENPFNYGDNLCINYNPNPNCPDNPDAITYIYTLWDRDKYRNEVEFCGTDDENDAGGILVAYSRGCDGSYFGQVSVFYDADGDDDFEIALDDFGATEAYYNLALSCRAYLLEIAESLGYEDVCNE